MTDIRFFFMVSLTANFEGRPQAGFNTLMMLNSRNVLARDIARLQEMGAQIVGNQEVPFDDIVVQNIMFLAECTQEEFSAGTELSEAAAEAQDLAAQADEAAGAEEALTAAVAERVEAVQDQLQDAANEAVVEDRLAEQAAEQNIGQSNDVSNLDAQAVESTPVDDVTTADVKSQD